MSSNAYIIRIDPASVISGRTELDLNSGPLSADHAGIDWGDAAVKPYTAEGRFGETPVEYRIPNRTISIPIGLGMAVAATPAEEITGQEAARRQLEQKVALLQRQGGVLLRQRGGPTERNLVRNPSFETNTTTWGAALKLNEAGATLTRVTAQHFSGAAALQIVTDNVGHIEGAETEIQRVVPKGTSYTASVYLKGNAGGEKASLRLGFSTTDSAVVTVTLTKEWQRVTVTWTAEAEHSAFWLAVQCTEKTKTIFADAAMVVIGSALTSYFDGDSPEHHWTATAEESVSETTTEGEALYADIVAATLTVPDVYGQTGGVEPGVVLRLECLPDFYGEEVELDAVEQVGQIVQVLQQGGKPAVIAGDYPARTRIVLTEKAKQNQKGLLWGLRSTNYDSAATSALFFDAKDLTPINGATVIEPGGGSTFSGKCVELKEPEPGVWHPFLTTDLSAGAKPPLTHIGSYRVWARVSAKLGQRVRLAWSLDDATQPVYNDAVTATPGAAAIFQDMDLGEVRLDEPPVGEHWWRGIVQVNTGAVSGPVFVDRIWLQPVDDGAGRLRATGEPTSTILGPQREGQQAESNATIQAGKAWTNPGGAIPPHAGEALIELLEAEKSQALLVKKLGFAIPGGTTIRGISVTLGGTQVGLFNETVKLVKGTTVLASKNVEFPGNLVPAPWFTYGSSGDLWERAWTPAEVNEAAFGAALIVTGEGAIATTKRGLVSSVTVRVYYSYSAGAIPEDAVLYSERKSEIRFDGGFREDTTTGAYVGISQVTGDLPRLPPSGIEQRPVELFVKNTRGDLTPETGDSGKDKISAQVLYRPSYLGRI